MTLSVDLYWSFRSPYSYLATGRLVRLAREYDVAINVRPVYPLAVRDDTFFQRVNPLFLPYLLRDVMRLSQMQGIPIGLPDPDPIVQDLTTGQVAKEQPYIFRLTRLGVEAAQRGHGLAFIDEVSRIIWGGTVRGWDKDDHLARAAERAGLNLAEMDAAIDSDPEKYDALIEKNRADLEHSGHWGVPTMVFDGEPFFGQDRIDVLVWRMNQKGLSKR
ncbi:MAG: 2-hydroxychromene-2-carboxylate isomerase [Sphingomonadales bacterium]